LLEERAERQNVVELSGLGADEDDEQSGLDVVGYAEERKSSWFGASA